MYAWSTLLSIVFYDDGETMYIIAFGFIEETER